MNKLINIFKQPDTGMVEKTKGNGLGFLKKRFVSRKERRRGLLEDSDVELMLLIAYNEGRDAVLSGELCVTGVEVANKVKEILL